LYWRIEMKKLFLFIALALTAAIAVYSCGGGGGGGSAATGSVAIFATDDMGDFRSVSAFINSVQIVHTGSGDSCTVLEDEPMDIAELSSTLELLGVEDCPQRSYNRIRFAFSPSVELTDSQETTATCTFDSYKDASGQPNRLTCVGDTCMLDINGAVNVFASQTEKLALDFVLKEFIDTGFPDPGCTVTMKVSPLNASGMRDKKQLGYRERVSGFVSDVTDATFILAKGNDIFIVDYSGATHSGALQSAQGLQDALNLAAGDHLLVRVFGSINLNTIPYSVTAEKVFIIAEGTMSNLDEPNSTFDLGYNGNTIAVDYTDAIVEGVLDDGSLVDVKLFGYDDVSMLYLAAKVEVE
jgi:hypothetical protein